MIINLHQKCIHAKYSQPLKIAEVKVWNDVSIHIREKMIHYRSTKSANKLLKKHYIQLQI